jgi:hypothetical protein
MQIHRFIDPAVAAAEPAAIARAVLRIHQRGAEYARNALHAYTPRNKAGWFELLIVFGCNEQGDFTPGQSMTVCMIQRTPEAEFEFHS